jgi:S-layer protein
VTGFEHLTLTGATNQTVDLAMLGNYNYVTTSGGNGLTLSNLSSGGTLELTGAGTAYTIGNSAFAAATNDTVNLKLTDGSGAGVAFASTGITASGVENFVITTADTQATPSGAFLDSVALLGNSAKSIVISGNAGLALTATDTALTTLDASGITLGGFTFTSGALAAAATIKGSAAGINTVNFSAATGGAVTYTGGTGADVITATNGMNNVISLGDGANAVVAAAGNNTITGGKDADVVTLTTGNNTVSLGNGDNIFTATSGNNTYTGGTGVDTVTVGGGVNTITTGTGADVVTFTAVTANGNSYSTITDAHSGLKIAFTDAGQLSGTTTFTSAKIALADTAVFQDYLDAATAADGSTNSHVAWFQYGGNTYVVEDNSAAATFQNNGDSVVKLAGLVDLSTATFAAVATTNSSLTLA